MKQYINQAIASLLVMWIAWVSYTLVDAHSTIKLVEFKLDSIFPAIQELYDK